MIAIEESMERNQDKPGTHSPDPTGSLIDSLRSLDDRRADLAHCEAIIGELLNVVERHNQAPPPKGIRAGLDVPESGLDWNTGGMIHLGGWAFDACGHAPVRVWVERGHQSIPCTLGWPRPDVIQIFADDLSVQPACGFNVEIEATPGLNQVSVYADFESQPEVCLFRRTLVRMSRNLVPKGQKDQDYGSWVRLYDSEEVHAARIVSDELQALIADGPLISVLLPTWNSDPRWLCEAIESIRSQLYSKWELCIADDASPKPHVRGILNHYASIDSRIKVLFRPTNGHISATSNSALSIATGSFSALLDHDDVLPRHALYEVAKVIQSDSKINLIYSDEDKIDTENQRFDPYFKSDWNPELFHAHNCISHLGVYRTSVLRDIGGFDEKLSGSQDWDLALRFIASAGEQGIHHIPKVLYHWRYLDDSTSKSIQSKPYAIEAGRNAIAKNLVAKNTYATVRDGLWAGSFRVQYHLRKPTRVCLIVHALDTQHAHQCLAALAAHTDYPHVTVWLLMPDGVPMPERCPTSLRIHRHSYPTHWNSGRAKNHAATEADAEVLVFLDGEMRPFEGQWLEEMTSLAVQPSTGAVGAWLRYEDGFTHHGGIVFSPGPYGMQFAFHGLHHSDIGHMGRAHLMQRYSAVSSSCIATRRGAFLRHHGWDHETFSSALSGPDYCLRLARDSRLATVWTPYARLTCHGTRNDSLPPLTSSQNELASFQQRWQHILMRDPCFNPNLAADDSAFRLSWPPRT